MGEGDSSLVDTEEVAERVSVFAVLGRSPVRRGSGAYDLGGAYEFLEDGLGDFGVLGPEVCKKSVKCVVSTCFSFFWGGGTDTSATGAVTGALSTGSGRGGND